jgi:hypothetical protein
VREFVRKRALGTNGLGYFGSFGWALLLAIPFATDRGELREVAPSAAIPAWLRWLANIPLGSHISFDGIRRSHRDPLFIAAPASPIRDVGRLSRRAAQHILTEAKAAITDATTNEAALLRIVDIAYDPPPGTTLAIVGDHEASRGRYEGNARGLLRELEAIGPTRSWGRFDVTPAHGWQHCITVQRAAQASVVIERWLAVSNIDAIVEPR